MSDAAAVWTCPFCPLLCDGWGVVAAADGTLALAGSDCPRAATALARFSVTPSAALPQVDGRPCSLDAAIAAAAALLRASRQPLFGGLGTDAAGARALYALACRCGAICDPAHGGALMQGVRAVQDRGGYSTTLAEIRTRADVLLCFGGVPTPRYPEFFRRVGIDAGDERVIVLADAGDDDLHAAASWLAALVEGRAADAAPAALKAAAARLNAARYAVVVYETAVLGAHAALVIGMLQRVVATLNRRTRAAALALGGSDGSSTVNQVFTWLSGLPLRSRPGPLGLQHEPLAYDAAALVADGGTDLLLWLASYGTEPPPPVAAAGAAAVPRIVIGHPDGAALPADVFIPVATPGIGSDGHLFRTDGVVLMPLHAVRADTLPTAAAVLQRLAVEVAQ